MPCVQGSALQVEGVEHGRAALHKKRGGRPIAFESIDCICEFVAMPTEGETKEKRSKEKRDKKKKDKAIDVDTRAKAYTKERSLDKRDKKKEEEKKLKKKKEEVKAAPQPRRIVKKAPAPTDYLEGMDLPPSEDDEEEMEERVIEEKELDVKVSDRESKKLAEKERLAFEKALRAKEEALKDDANAFDVSFEGQGSEATLSATDVVVHKLTVRVKGKVLLEDTSLSISAGRRYGLVGPNGMGKSTLLRLMAQRQIPVPEYIDVLLVEQEVVGDDRTALRAVIEADVEVTELQREEKELTEKLTSMGEDASDEASGRLNEIYDRLHELGASSAEARASKILHGLGFTKVMQQRQTQSFSGGWRMRISLARALFIQPTLLLLDEPTNHLDLRAVLWLEEYLQRWKKTLIVVSHDRDFLNTVTTDVMHLYELGLHFYKSVFWRCLSQCVA